MCALNVSCLIRRAAFEAGCSACRTSEAQEWRRRAAVTPSAARPPGKRAAHGSAEGGSCREGRPQGPGSPSEGREGEPGRQAGPVPVCGLLREQGPRADGPASDRQGAVSRPRGPRTPSGPSATTRRAHGCSSASNVLPCEQRTQGWAPPAASLLSRLRHRGRPPSLEPPALGPPFQLSSCGSELWASQKPLQPWWPLRGDAPEPLLHMIQGDFCSHNLPPFP